MESEQSDRADRLEATIAFRQIKHWLDQNAEYGFRRLKKLPEGSRYEGGFLMDLDLCDLDHYSDLAVIFLPKLEVEHGLLSGSYGQSKDGRHKFIFICCLRAAGDTTYLNTRFTTSEKHFVHEFMHYLMSRRRGGKVEPSAKKLKAGDSTEYHNDNDETNAYYQEAAHSAIEYFRVVKTHAPDKYVQEYRDMTNQEMVSFVITKFVDRVFYSELNQNNRRAFLKRLVRCVEETIRPILA